jgi:hypothetical protein
MINRLRPEDVWHPKRGAPRGNRNRHKHGLRGAAFVAWRKRKQAWRRRVRAALQALDQSGFV